MADNVSSIIDEALTKLLLDTATPIQIERSSVLQEVNNCLKDLAVYCNLFLATDNTSIVLEADVANYTLPDDLMDIIRLGDENKKRLWPISIPELDNYKSDWAEDRGEPRYFIRGYDGMDCITLYRCPDQDQAGKLLTLRYKKYPVSLFDDVTSFLPSPISNERTLVMNYVLGNLFLMKSAVQDMNKAQVYLGLYYKSREFWRDLKTQPDKLRIYGIRGENSSRSYGPSLPDNYPRLGD